MNRCTIRGSLLGVALLVTGGCSSKQGGLVDSDASTRPDDVTLSAEQCSPSPPAACPEPVPTFAVDVQPILEARCASCHGTLADVWPLHTYKDVADWRELVRAMVLDCTMPPADAGTGVTNEERNTLLTWLGCGLPR